MKIFLRLLLIGCLTVLISETAKAQHQQLVSNGSLDFWTINGPSGPPDYWNETNGLTSSRDTILVHGGLSSARLISGSTTISFLKTDSIPIFADSTYSCSLWVYDTDGSGSGRIRFQYDTGPVNSTTSSLDTAAWMLYTFTNTAPPGAHWLTLEYMLAHGPLPPITTLNLDDVVLWGPKPFHADTTRYLSYMPTGDIGVFSPQVVWGNRESGIRYTNPDPTNKIKVEWFRFFLYKHPGQTWPSTRDVRLKIYSVNDSLLPDREVYADVIPGSLIASGWALGDSIRAIDRAINPDSNIYIDPAGEFVATLGSVNGDSFQIAAYNSGEPPNEDEGPCNLDDARMLEYMSEVGGQWVYINGHWAPIVARVSGPYSIYQPIFYLPILQEPTFQYFNQFSNHWPLVNNIRIPLNSHFSDLIKQIEVLVAGQSIIYGPSSWARDNILYIADNQMCSQAEGTHLFKIKVNGTEYYRTCFYNEDRPLHDAPWALVTNQFTDLPDPDGQYSINGIVPPVDLYKDYSFDIWKLHMRNVFDFNVGATQLSFIDSLHHREGSINVDDQIELTILNHSYVNEHLALVGEERFWEGDPNRYFYLYTDIPDPGYGIDLGDYTIIDGPLCPPIPIGPIILTIQGKLGIRGAVYIYVALQNPPDPDADYPYGYVKITPQLSPYATVSANVSLAVASAKFTGNGILTMCFPITFNGAGGDPEFGTCFIFVVDYKVTAKLDLGFWSKTWRIACGRLNALDNCPGNICGPPPLDCGDRAILDNPWNHAWDTTFYEPPVAAINASGDKMMALCVHRENSGNDEIYYSTLENNNWTQPAAATHNTFTKSDVQIAPYLTNSWVAAWVENPAQYDTNNVTVNYFLETTKTQEITVSAFDPATQVWQAPQRLTADQLADGKPVITSFDNNIVVAWVKNTSPSEFAFTNTRIYYAIFNGTDWSAPQFIGGQVGSNLMPTLAADLNYHRAALTWVQDLDGNMNTPEDRSLKLTYIDLQGFSDPVTVPSAIGPFNPDLAAGANGKLAVVYESHGYLYDSSGVAFDTVGVITDQARIFSSILRNGNWSISNVGTDSVTGFGSDPKVAIGSNGYANLGFSGYEKDLPGIWDREIYYSKININDSLARWDSPARFEDDTLWTDMGDISVDPQGMIRILYLKDSAPTQTFPVGYDQIYQFVTGQGQGYIPGDANGSGGLNGLDVTYGVSYFKGGPPPPNPRNCPPHGVWFVNGDVNGSCSYNGLDITYLVAYFKGGPPPQPCPDCPPPGGFDILRAPEQPDATQQGGAER